MNPSNDLEYRFEKAEELEQGIEETEAQISELEAELKALRSRRDDLEDRKPQIAAAGVYREGGAGGTTKVVRKPWEHDAPAANVVARIDNYDPKAVVDISDDVYNDPLPDLRKNGFKGAVVVDVNNEVLVEYYTPEEILDEHFDQAEIEAVVEASVSDVHVVEDISIDKMYEDAYSSREERKRLLRQHFDEADYSFEDLVGAIAELYREKVAALDEYPYGDSGENRAYRGHGQFDLHGDGHYKVFYTGQEVGGDDAMTLAGRRGGLYEPRVEDVAEQLEVEEFTYTLTEEGSRERLSFAGRSGFVAKLVRSIGLGRQGGARDSGLQFTLKK